VQITCREDEELLVPRPYSFSGDHTASSLSPYSKRDTGLSTFLRLYQDWFSCPMATWERDPVPRVT
jgi:hypothetical protein